MKKSSEHEIIKLVLHAQNGCISSKEKLVANYKQLISSYVNRLPAAIEREDAIQEGMKALLLAISHFDVKKGKEFTSFLVATVRGEVLRYSREYNLLKIPRSVYDTVKQIKDYRTQFVHAYGIFPTNQEIMKALQLTSDQFVLAENSNNTHFSLHEMNTSCRDKKTCQTLPIEQYIGELTNPYVELEWEVLLKETIKQTLSPFEQKIITYRFYFEFSQKQTAKELNVNQMKISRTEKSIVKKMHQYLTKEAI